MQIIDNFLPDELFQSIKCMFCRSDFPWFWGEEKISQNPLMCDQIQNFQLCHVFYDQNKFYSTWNIYPIIEKLKVNALVRAKANLTIGTSEIVKYGYHVDTELDCNTAIYYINTNNGYTEFVDDVKVESFENRVLIFNSKLKHTGTSCTDSKRRMVLNINYF